MNQYSQSVRLYYGGSQLWRPPIMAHVLKKTKTFVFVFLSLFMYFYIRTAAKYFFFLYTWGIVKIRIMIIFLQSRKLYFNNFRNKKKCLCVDIIKHYVNILCFYSCTWVRNIIYHSRLKSILLVFGI